MELISRERLVDEVVKIAKTSESDWRGVKFSASEIKFIIERQKLIESRPNGVWIDNSEDGYVECPFCHSATTCEDNIEELHFCWNCGAELTADMRGEQE